MTIDIKFTGKHSFNFSEVTVVVIKYLKQCSMDILLQSLLKWLQCAFKNQKRELWVISHQLLCDPYHRFVCQDIGGSDPERMAAPRVEEYICELFEGSPVKVSWFDSFNLSWTYFVL